MIEDILERLKDYEDDTGIIEIWSNQLRLLLKEYLQEPTEDREVEIKREMEKLKSTLDKLKSMWLSITYNTYYSLVEELRENNIKTS